MNSEENFKRSIKEFVKQIIVVSVVIVFLGSLLYFIVANPNYFKANENPKTEFVELPKAGDDFDKIENGIHVQTGLVQGDGLMLVVQNCTSCHSAKLVTQNRMSKEKWLATIRWMQESQNLWNLGVNEEPILNYLSTNYAPNHIGRRANLTNVEWYELKD